ncbi:hypothetical protein ACFWR9_41750 [Streptomyces sp. NPDC058534]|uniref:hypothetical protein n=1 Tax=Streptomyces sp. NPDC058534 TaxID=3346541 RepID=UPI003666271B
MTDSMPDQPGTAPAPLPPALVSAILRDADSPLYPSKIVVFCDGCGTEVAGEFMVSTEQTSAERLEVARAHFRTQGWQCDRSGDYCPAHKAANDACPGVSERGHGLTGTTVHVGCCPASR